MREGVREGRGSEGMERVERRGRVRERGEREVMRELRGEGEREKGGGERGDQES